MRSLMRALAVVCATALAVAALPADDKTKTDDKTTKPADKTKATDKEAVRPVGDAEFVVIAASSGAYQVEAGKLAKDLASSDDVKKFAEHTVADHTKANKELAEVATKAGLGLPVQLLRDHAGMLEALRLRRGPDFDREYVAQQVKAHNEAVALFENASKNAKDAGLKDFATKMLPTLKDHQKQARALAKGEGKTDGKTDGSKSKTGEKDTKKKESKDE